MHKRDIAQQSEASKAPKYGLKLFYYILGQLLFVIIGYIIVISKVVRLALGVGNLGEGEISKGIITIIVALLIAYVGPGLLIRIALKKTFHEVKNRRKILIYLSITPLLLFVLSIYIVTVLF